MTSMLCVALFLVSMATTSLAFIEGSCPYGCADSQCYLTLGCTNCRADYCMKFTKSGLHTISMCVTSCGDGMYCQNSIKKICTSCGVAHCKSCSEAHKCENCETGYTLDQSGTYDHCV